MALERLGVSRHEALYVGDTVIDAETARRAGVPFVAVTSGFTSQEAFGDYPAAAILGGVAELPALLLDEAATVGE